jgi:hypothetical protein
VCPYGVRERRQAMQSYIVTWEDPKGGQHRNQVWGEDRDGAIWRLAYMMQGTAAAPKFISCELETAENTPGRN